MFVWTQGQWRTLGVRLVETALFSLLEVCSRCLDILPVAVESMPYFICVAILNFFSKSPSRRCVFQGTGALIH